MDRTLAGDLVVLKFGGTSVGTPARVRRAARRVRAWRERARVVVVVSATGHTTDRILRWVVELAPANAGRVSREIDRAVSTGEDQAAGYLAAALIAHGVPAVSLRGTEAGLLATGEYGRGVLDSLDGSRIESVLDAGMVPVVSGFHAPRADGETVTLGRGGSDITGVFLAAHLCAKDCHIITDVDAVYDADPHLFPGAVRFRRLTHADLVELAEAGAAVIHPTAARLAAEHRVPLRIYHHRAGLHGAGTRVRAGPEDAAGNVRTTCGRSDAGVGRAGVAAAAGPAVRGDACTVHLLGPGRVGRALLSLLDGGAFRVVAVTDTSGTLHDPRGLDALAVAAHKAAAGRIVDLPGAGARHVADAATTVAADIVVDTTATRFDRSGWARALEDGVLARGGALALAAKDAVCESPEWWNDPRVGCNAVLGGTGLALHDEIEALRADWLDVALAGNASTTAIIEAIEGGATIDAGIAAADGRGYLEADPELDLRGRDAAVKLATVAGALLGRGVDPRSLRCPDARDLDPAVIRERAARGATTRLIGRATREGRLSIAYEEVSAASALNVPCDRVAYLYRCGEGVRVHVGDGLGSLGTARAVLVDLIRLARSIRARGGHREPGAPWSPAHAATP